MTIKQKILRMIERLPEDVAYDRVLYHIEVMQRIEERLAVADKEPKIDHDELFARLEEHDGGEDRMDGAGESGLERNRTSHCSSECSTA